MRPYVDVIRSIHENDSEGFYLDRVDDRGCDHRHSGSGGVACVPGLQHPGEDVRGDTGRERMPHVDQRGLPKWHQCCGSRQRLGLRNHNRGDRGHEVCGDHRYELKRPGHRNDDGFRRCPRREACYPGSAVVRGHRSRGHQRRHRDALRLALWCNRRRHERALEVSARLLPRLTATCLRKKVPFGVPFFWAMIASALRRFPHVIGVALIAGLACGLYWPFLGNPRVFDDWTFFSGIRFSYFATHPFGLDLRLPPYFSLAVTEVLVGCTEAHRLVGLAFHIACALALYKLIYDLLQTVSASGRPVPGAQSSASAWAFLGAAAFAIHPVAVYGAGYLVQRTIVFATLFSLLSIVLFVRGLARGRHADAMSAALMYSIAVLSKEHSVLLPVAAALAVSLVKVDFRFSVRHAAIYLSACAPAAIFVTLLQRSLIGEVYEPDFAVVATQIEGVFGHAIADFPLAMSAVAQAGLFFKYVALWLWPDIRGMSIDLRVDFLETWSAGWIVLKVSAFVAFGALGFLLLRRRGRLGVAGFGMLYAWILFLVELSTARFQEPFVLYRSYLWAPGIVIALVALLSAVPLRAALTGFAFAGALLLYQAHDRLVSFSSSTLLWEDAVAKLPAKPVPWGSRTLYMLGREYVYGGRPDKAIEIADRCMTQYPDTVHCYYARGVIHFLLEEYKLALPYLLRAVELRPDSGIAHHRLGLVLERLGRIRDAKAEYRQASDLGYKGADFEIRRLESSGAGSLVSKRTTRASR